MFLAKPLLHGLAALIDNAAVAEFAKEADTVTLGFWVFLPCFFLFIRCPTFVVLSSEAQVFLYYDLNERATTRDNPYPTTNRIM